MKTIFILQGLTCPNCAGKIERAVQALPAVETASLNLLQQTLMVTADTPPEALLSEIRRIVDAHEPEVEVRLQQLEKAAPTEEESHKKEIFRLVFAAVFYAAGWLAPGKISVVLFFAAFVIAGYDVVWGAVRNITKGHIFDENFLMTISTIGAFAIGSAPEGAAVMVLYQIGEFFQERAVHRSRKSIADLMNIRPDTADVLRDGTVITVSPETVQVGEQVLVKPGGQIPLDGVVAEGDSMLDTRALTGESVPRAVHPGDAVLSGCINQSGALTVTVTKPFCESTVAKILELVESASGRKAPAENFITAFARYYTPAVVLLAVLLAIVPPLVLSGGWTEWIRRSLVFLVISCPCALVISVPLTFFGGIGAASKRGVLVKGGNYLDALNKLETIIFDKTGTLTKGVFQVAAILPAAGISQETVLETAQKAELLSEHPIARSIRQAAKADIDASQLSGYMELAGMGVSVMENGRKIIAGNHAAMEKAGIICPAYDEPGTVVYVAADGEYLGCIVIADTIKSDSAKTIKALKKLGIPKTVMLTGDRETIAAATAEALGIDEYYAELLPDGKVAVLEQLADKQSSGKIAFVGDGINDAPVLARADVGIAMGGIGSDAAIAAADVVLMTDEPSKLLAAIETARKTRRIVTENIVFALGVKSVFLVLGAFGIAGMWEAVFGDVGVMVLAVLNAMRILKK